MKRKIAILSTVAAVVAVTTGIALATVPSGNIIRAEGTETFDRDALIQSTFRWSPESITVPTGSFIQLENKGRGALFDLTFFSQSVQDFTARMGSAAFRDMVLENVFVPDDSEVLPPGLFGAMYNAFPHLFLSFSATFLGLMQAAYDDALAYLTGRMPGAPIPHTEIAAKGPAIAEMLFAIEAARALYYRAISEAEVNAPLEAVQRARAAHVTVQRGVVAVTQEAIRVCGGRAFLKRYPLERYARDARAAALMRPWTEEIATQQAWEAALDLDGQRGDAAGT